MSTESDAIIMNDIVKTFGHVRALDGLNLSVLTGEVHGFLGPNGAGKSTAIRVLLGQLHADSGTAQVLGGDPCRDAVELHRRLAYVPGDVNLWPNLSGGAVIDLLARLRGGIDVRRRDELIERFELDPRKKGRAYSKGNRQKVAIVAALASDVELLILDEPTSGLDPLMENVFQEVVGEAKERGASVLLSSHILAEAESLADRISIIRDGKVVTSGTLEELRGNTRSTVHASLDRLPGPGGLSVLHGVHLDGHRITGSVESARVGEAMEELTGYGITALTVEPPSLESLFLRLYEDDGAPADAVGGDASPEATR